MSFSRTTKPRTELVLYADESDQSGGRFGNFFGGALVSSKDLEDVRTGLLEAKDAVGLSGSEMKWNAITPRREEAYKHLVGEFFDLVEQGMVKVRVMFTDNRFEAVGLEDYHREHRYHLLYYQFVRHAFGLTHCDLPDPIRVRLYLDNMPQNEEKIRRFKGHLAALSRNAGLPSGSHLHPGGPDCRGGLARPRYSTDGRRDPRCHAIQAQWAQSEEAGRGHKAGQKDAGQGTGLQGYHSAGSRNLPALQHWLIHGPARRGGGQVAPPLPALAVQTAWSAEASGEVTQKDPAPAMAMTPFPRQGLRIRKEKGLSSPNTLTSSQNSATPTDGAGRQQRAV
jgi:hypothetical protein